MYFSIIDCGTTNSHVSILNEKQVIVGRSSEKIGVKDTVTLGSKEALKQGLKTILLKAAAQGDLKVSNVKFAIAAGMITSEIGLLDVPRLQAPVGISDLVIGLKVVNDPAVFPLNIPVIFIPGIKNNFPKNASYWDLRKMDFMRGEETQIMGLLAKFPKLPLPLSVVILGSHTKFVYLNSLGQICGSLTTVSGQIYEAIAKNTSIGKSLQHDSNHIAPLNCLNTELVQAAYDVVKNAGFLRALLMPRLMEVLLTSKWHERRLFVSTAIIAEDLKTLREYGLLNFSLESSFVLIGQQERCEIMKYLLDRVYGIKNVIKQIQDDQEINDLAIQGGISIARRAGFLDK